MPRQLGTDSIQTVNARELHGFLGVGTAFKDWITRRIDDYGLTEGTDFCSFLSESTGGRPAREYALSLSAAKELSMVERTPKGKEARQYFIECERRAKAPAALPVLTPAQMLAAIATQAAEQEQRMLALSAKVERCPHHHVQPGAGGVHQRQPLVWWSRCPSDDRRTGDRRPLSFSCARLTARPASPP